MEIRCVICGKKQLETEYEFKKETTTRHKTCITCRNARKLAYVLMKDQLKNTIKPNITEKQCSCCNKIKQISDFKTKITGEIFKRCSECNSNQKKINIKHKQKQPKTISINKEMIRDFREMFKQN